MPKKKKDSAQDQQNDDKGQKSSNSQRKESTVANANKLKSLKLAHINKDSEQTPESPFDYSSSLFVAYIRSSLMSGSQSNGGLELVANKTNLTLSVFGENQLFKVVDFEQLSPSNDQQETKEEIKEETIEESKEDVKDLEEASTMKQVYCVTKDTNIEVTRQPNNFNKDEDSEDDEIAMLNKLFAKLKISDDYQGVDQEHQQVEFSGYSTQIATLNEIINIKLLTQDNDSSRISIKGVLLHGPSGIGKSMAVQSVLKNNNKLNEIHKIRVTPKDLINAPNGINKRLQSIFKLAQLKQPSILVLEDIDFVASSGGKQSSSNKETLYSLLDAFDGFSAAQSLIIATTSKLDEVDKSLRRGGRLDIDVRMDMPDSNDRFQILHAHLQRQGVHEMDGLEMTARAASGFVASDLAQIVRNAQLKALRQNQSLSKSHLEQAIIDAKPLSISDLLVEVPKTYWSEIGGNEQIKFQVRQCVEWPLKYPQKFHAMGIKPPQGILLYGPPGCSKTMIAKALATESGLNFIAVKGPELFSKYVGDTEKAIREIFRKARLSSPSIIFFDEIDAMATQRGADDTSVSDRALCQLLNEMDGVESRAQVIVVGATNRLDTIDTALLRPGRFDRLVHVPLPTEETRRHIFEINCAKMQTVPKEQLNLDQLAKTSEGMSGAEIALVTREAGLKALTEDKKIETAAMEDILVSQKHLMDSLDEVQQRGKPQKKSLFTNK